MNGPSPYENVILAPYSSAEWISQAEIMELHPRSRPRPAPHGLVLGLGLHDLGLRNPILPRIKVREYPILECGKRTNLSYKQLVSHCNIQMISQGEIPIKIKINEQANMQKKGIQNVELRLV